MKTTRREFLEIGAQGLVLLGAAGGGWPAMAQGKRAVTITQAVKSLAYIQNYVAHELGAFGKEGLEAKLLDTGGGGPDVQIVLAGKAEFTANDGAQVLPALQQGKKMVCVLALLDRAIINVTMRKDVAQKLGISESTPFSDKLKAMKGLKIGVTRPGALTWQMARSNVIAAGLNPDRDVQITGIGGAPALAAALENGEIDAIYISLPIGEKLVGQGKAITFINNARGEDPRLATFIMEGLWATPEFIQKEPDVVKRTVRALKSASDYIVANTPEQTAKVLTPSLGALGEEALLAGCRMAKDAVSKTGRFTQADLDASQAILEQNGFLKKAFKIEEIFDPQFVG